MALAKSPIDIFVSFYSFTIGLIVIGSCLDAIEETYFAFDEIMFYFIIRLSSKRIACDVTSSK